LKKLLLISALCLLICSNTAFGATVTWIGALSSNWNTPGNWLGGIVPNTGDIVNIGTGTNFTNQPTISVAPANIPSVINIGNSKAVTLTINSGFTLTVGAINMSATSINSSIVVNGTLTVTGNITLGAASSNTNNKLTLGSTGKLTLGGTFSGGTVDPGAGTSTIQLNGIVAQPFPNSTVTTYFITNNIHTLESSNLVGVTLTTGFTSNYLACDHVLVDNNCMFDANATLVVSGTYYATIGVNSVYISKSLFVEHPNDVYDITATLKFTAASQTIDLSATGTVQNSCPNVIFTGTSININGQPGNTIMKFRGNVSVTASSTITTYTNITSLDIDGNYNGTNSLASGSFPIDLGGSWNNTDTQPIAGIVNYNGNNIDSTQIVSTHAIYQNNITFSGLSTKQIQSGTTQCAGALFDNSAGSFVDCITNSSTVLMNGTVDQTINGGTASNSQIGSDPVTGIIFNNLTIANTAATTPTVTMLGNNNIGPNGVISFTKSNNTLDCTAANSLTLMSIGTGTATVGDITNGGAISGVSITGTVNAQRFITGGALKYRSYRFFSAPVYMGTQTLGLAGTGNVYNLKYLNTANTAYPITSGNAGGGFDKTGNPTIYVFREDRNVNNGVFTGGNYIGIANITGTIMSYNTFNNTTTSGYLPVGNGFAFFYRGSKANLAGRTTLPIASSTNWADNGNITTAGTLNQGTIPVILWYNDATANNYQTTLSFTAAVAVSAQGFNLVGNPYASSIDWSKFSATVSTAAIYGPNVNPTVYELDPANSIFGTYNSITQAVTGNGSKTISSGQGFFVKAANTSATLKFTEQAKSNTQLTSGSTLLFSAQAQATTYNQYIRLDLAKDTTGKSEIVVGFNPGSNKNYNQIEDDLYLGALSPTNQSMWTTSNDNIKLVTKWQALPKAKQQDNIGITVNGAATGQFTLTRSELKGIPKLYKVWLMDMYMKDSLDLRNNSTYVFNINLADTNTFGSKRFQVIVRQDPALGVHLLNFTALKAIPGAQTIWKVENEDHYTNFAIERSTDNGATYKTLDSLVSDGSGTYNFIDKNPLSVNMYRLKMTDLNSAITYSNVVTLQYSNVSNDIASSRISVYPNPSRGVIHLAIDNILTTTVSGTSQSTGSTILAVGTNGVQNYGIKIISITGTVVKNTTSSSANWQDNVSNLAPGTYIIQVTNNSDKSLVGKSTFIKI
jgi:hypothetical protein